MKKKLLAILMTFIMTLTALPMNFAVSAENYSVAASDASARGKSIVNDYKNKYYYTQLSNRKKKIYKDIYTCLSEYKKTKKLSVDKVTVDEFCQVWYYVIYDNPQFYYVDYYTRYKYEGSYVTYVKPIYYTKKNKNIENYVKKVETKVKKIVENGLKKSNSYETALYFHDYLLKNVKESDSEGYDDFPNGVASGALLNGKATYEGYAQAFSLLCQEAGIPCMTVKGDINESVGYYCWNRVKLGKYWYNVEVSGDDYCGDKYGTNAAKHSYCFLSDKQFYSFHTYDTEITTKEILKNSKAISTTFNFFEQKGVKVYYDAEEAYNALIKKAVKNYKKGTYRVSVYCSPDVIAEAYEILEANINTDCELYEELYNCTYIGCSVSEGWLLYIDFTVE